MNTSRELNWAPLIPLIGGFPLGAESAFNSLPSAILSYSDFTKNDRHYVNYIQNIRNHKDIEYIHIDKAIDYNKKFDVIVGTPPCAALSQLNTGKTAAVKGAGCQKNEWMYRIFENAIDRFGAKVVVIENAPALYTKKGESVAQRLYEIVLKREYSLTLYKTSTMFHGIPQKRDRTFAIAWNRSSAPILNFYDRPRKNFREYLENVSDDLLHQDLIINQNAHKDHYYEFIRYKTNKDPRQLMIDSKTRTSLQYVMKHYSLNEALDWFEKINHKKGIRHVSHAIKKHEIGLGVWDSSAHVFGDVMCAVIGRNMSNTLHPTQNRSLTVREALYMMGFPNDFELLGGRKSINHIAQNVPVCTARDICHEIDLYLKGKLSDSGCKFIRQNNMNKEIIEVVSNRVELTTFLI